MTDRAETPLKDPAFAALVVLTDPWLFGREDAVRAKLTALAPLDWQAMIATADRHRVTPLLAERVRAAGLQDHPAIAPPDNCARALQQRGREALASELSTFAELRRLKSLFDSEGIPFLVFKGLTLSQLCFGKLGVRVNRDTDILVAPGDIDRADALVRTSGYRRVEPSADAGPAAIERAKERTKDWVYVHETQRTILEIHYRLFDNPWLCDAGAMSRARTVQLFGQLDVATLGADDELAYLALHGAMHAWSRLKWLIDFAILVRDRPPAQTEGTLRQARGGPAACAIHQAIALCWRLFSPDTPEPREGRPLRTGPLAAAAMYALAANKTQEIEDTSFGTTLKNASHYLLWGKPAYLAAEFAYDITYSSEDLPSSKFGLPIWLWRPLMWAGRRFRLVKT